MNRILKRPMFRMGGSTGTGITSGLDRQNYQMGGGAGMARDNIRFSDLPLMKTQNTPTVDDKSVPKTSFLNQEGVGLGMGTLPGFLTQFGLNLVSATPRGNIFATAAESAKEPFSRFQAAKFKEKQSEDEFKKDLSLALATLKPESKTAAVKNALAMGLEPGTKPFNDYVTAATIKQSGLNLEFDDKGNLKSISQGGVPINKKFQEKGMELKNATFAMNNVANSLINNLKGAKVQTVGSVISALDSFGAQLKQLAEATGFKQNFVNTNSTAIDDYLRQNLGEGIFADSVKYGKIRSNAINLAYLMARVDEPGGRFTDRDIALKMEEIGIGANPERTAQILAAAVDLRNKNAGFAYKQLTGEDLNFEGFTLQDTSKKTTKTDELGMDEFKFIDGVLHKKVNGKFVKDF